MKTLNLDSDVISGKKKIQPKPTTPEVPAVQEIPAMPTKLEKPLKTEVAVPDGTQKAKKPSKFGAVIRSIVGLPKRFLVWYQNLSLGKKTLVSLLISVSALGGGALIVYYTVIVNGKTDIHPIPSVIPAEKTARTSYSSSITFALPGTPRTTPNPINGDLYTKSEFENFSSRFPIAVMIENHIDARNQSGFNSADLVFETIAEGGITRTMAIFWGKSVPEIGPVRSARTYYLEWAIPFDPLYMHIGYAVSDDPRTDVGGMLSKYNVKTLNRGGTFWRVSEKLAPHNAYTSTELLYQMAENYGYTGTPAPIESWAFKRDAALDQRGSKTTAIVAFHTRLSNGGVYDITWKYDRSNNVYMRYSGDTPYLDHINDSPIWAKNVIIQKVKAVPAYDESARMIVTTTGTGDAIILRDGLVIHGTWRKDDVEKRTRFVTSDGNEIELNRGITWIQAVPTDLGTVQIDS